MKRKLDFLRDDPFEDEDSAREAEKNAENSYEETRSEEGAPHQEHFQYCSDLACIRSQIPPEKKRIHMHGTQKLRIEWMERILQNKGCAKIASLPQHTMDLLDDFDHHFPNMLNVSQHLRDAFSLQMLSGQPMVKIGVPLLLLGPQGIGKTYALNWLAKRLGVKTHKVGCSDASNGFDLTGLSAGYGTGKPGCLARLLVMEQCANPIVILDEIDKARPNSVNDSLQDRFYTLLEEESAREFQDEFLETRLDISMFNWVATANDAEPIPDPILDRFRVVELKPFTEDQLRQIIPLVYREMLQDNPWGKLFAPELDERLLNRLLDLGSISARKARSLLHAAIGRAARRLYTGSHRRRMPETPIELLPEDMEHVIQASETKMDDDLPHIGFI